MRATPRRSQREIPYRHDFGTLDNPSILAESAKKNDSPAIARPIPSPNPYFGLARRTFSEPLLLLLIFVFGVWLWKNHILTGDGYEPGSCELALIKADRDLRIAESSTHLPTWLPPALQIQSLDLTVNTASNNLQALARKGALTPDGAYALAILIAVQENGNPATGPFAQLGLPGPPTADEVTSRIINGRETWWDLRFLEGLDLPATAELAKLVESRNKNLAANALKARGAVLALVLGGIIFLPGTLLAFGRAGRPHPKNYAERWPLSLGIGVFLLAYLAFIGFGTGIDGLLGWFAAHSETQEPFPMGWFIALDALSRLLPAAIALALLFRRTRHATSRLGLAGPLDGRLVLGSFALIWILDFGIRMTLGMKMPPNPTGGLSASEAGPWGLIFAVTSACLVAPYAEEILYRGVLFRSLANRLRLFVAVGISSVVFALTHFYNYEGLATLFVFGAVAALCFASSRTLLTAIALHALYNASIKIPEWIVYQAPLS